MKNQMNLFMVNMSGLIQGESNATKMYKKDQEGKKHIMRGH